MKKIINKKKFSLAAATLFAMAVAVSVLFYACKKPTDGINVLVDSQLLSPGATTIVFVNADSTSTNQPGDFNVSITGPGASLVQMVSGGTTFKASHGMLPLSLVKGTNPTASSPVNFTVTASASGFAPFVQTISVTSTDPALYVVKAFDYLTASAGTSLLTKPTTVLTAGTLGASGLTLTTTTGTSITENATITFPAGTQMKDVNNNLISASNLVCNVVQLSSNSDAIINDFPGGLYTQNALDKTGTAITDGVGFVPAAFLSIGLTADGTPVRNFSKTVTINAELNSSLINFSTDVAVKVGDVIPYWSQNDQTGQWKYEGDATVFLDANNKLAVSIPITHLSNWMCGWFWTAATVAGKSTGTCGSPFIAKINSPFPLLGVTIKLTTAAGAKIANGRPVLVSTADGVYHYKFTFTKVPGKSLAKIAAYGPFSATPLAVSSTFDPCAAGTVEINVPANLIPSASNIENVSINIQGICNGKQVAVLPTASFLLYQKKATSVYVYAGDFTIINGIGATQLNVGSTYYMSTYYNGTYYQTGDFTVTAGAVTIPNINGFNVSTTYDAPTNVLSLKGVIPIPCN